MKHIVLIARVAWVAVAAATAAAAAGALEGRSDSANLVATISLWSLWAVVLVALIVPSTAGLTVARVVGPLATVIAVVLWATGAGAVRGAIALAVTVLFAAMLFSAELGQSFAQASAYGHEQRLVLRIPVAMVLPLSISWLVWATATVAAGVVLAAQQWLVGAVLAAAATGLTWLLIPRFHQLSRRWLVLVPSGVVVHDPVVLADTFMLTKPAVAGLRLAPADTGAADLSGPAAGHLVEVTLHDMATVVLAGTRSKPTGTALHVGAFLVAPSRPGRALAAAAAGRLRVG